MKGWSRFVHRHRGCAAAEGPLRKILRYGADVTGDAPNIANDAPLQGTGVGQVDNERADDVFLTSISAMKRAGFTSLAFAGYGTCSSTHMIHVTVSALRA
jgi:hypothetical protein